MNRLARQLVLGVWLVPLCLLDAEAGGLLAQELATPRNGTAQAGQAAYAYDAATAFYNPAGMARLEEPATLLGVQPLFAEVEFDSNANSNFPGGDGGEQGGFAPGLAAYYVRPLDDRWAVGISTVGIAGGALDPSNSWAGRFAVTDLSLVALTVNPVVSFRVNEWMTVGAGVAINYGRLNFDLRLPRLTPGPEGEVEMDGVDDVVPNFNVGVLFEPLETTRIGLTYRSKIDFELSGDFDVKNTPPFFQMLGLTDGDVEADIPIAQFVRLSLYHELHESFAVLVDLGWEDWSVMDFTPITGPSGRQLQVPRNWRDTWHYGIGFEWTGIPGWMFQTGFSYDTSPVSSRSDNRPDLPADRQWRYSFGLVYDWSETIQVGVNYTYIDLGRSPIDMTNPFGRISGDYAQNQAHAVALFVSF